MFWISKHNNLYSSRTRFTFSRLRVDWNLLVLSFVTFVLLLYICNSFLTFSSAITHTFPESIIFMVWHYYISFLVIIWSAHRFKKYIFLSLFVTSHLPFLLTFWSVLCQKSFFRVNFSLFKQIKIFSPWVFKIFTHAPFLLPLVSLVVLWPELNNHFVL